MEQIAARPVYNPGGYITEHVVALADGEGMGAPISMANPLPVRADSRTIIPLPFSALDRVEAAGAASASISGNFAENDDGTQSGMIVTVPASATFANSVQLRRVINGNLIGIRLSRATASVLSGSLNAPVPFGAMVDGQPIEIDWSAQLFPETHATGLNNGAYRNIIFGTDFGEGAHDVRLSIPCDASSARQIGLLGWLVDEAAGYRPPQRGVSLQDMQMALTSTAKFYLGFVNGARGLVGFYYANSTAAAVTLDLFAANSGLSNRLTRVTVAANGDGYFALPGIVYDGIQLQAGTANALLITPVGAM